MKKTITTDTDFLAISVDEAKAWLRIDIADDDDLIVGLIKAATAAAEAFTDRTITPASVEFQIPLAGQLNSIPSAPISAVSKIEIEDRWGVRSQLIAETDYHVRLFDAGAAVALCQGSFGLCRGHSLLVVTCDAGYAVSADVPQAIKQAIAVNVGSNYMNREGQDTAKATFENLLRPFQIGGV